MYWLVGLMGLSLMGIIVAGVYLEIRPLPRRASPPRVWKGVMGLNLIGFVGAELGLLMLGVHDVMAQPVPAVSGPQEISVGMGLALIGIGIPTALATIGAGIAVGPVGASSLAVISEKPEMFGRSLIYLGLAEGIAIYGLVVTILLLGKIP
jgi:V/A-type H+-transporting ATPase subunit K